MQSNALIIVITASLACGAASQPQAFLAEGMKQAALHQVDRNSKVDAASWVRGNPAATASGPEVGAQRRTQHQISAGCFPLAAKTANETTAWLETTFPGVLKPSYVARPWAERVDGAALAAYAKGPHALSSISPLLDLVPMAHIPALVRAVQLAETHHFLSLPPAMDPCSKLYTEENKGSNVEVSAVVEKVLDLDTDTYTFEVIFNIGFMWEEDRMALLPVATPEEMDACPEPARCGMCVFNALGPSETCVPRMANGWTDPRSPFDIAKGAWGPMGLNKCCAELWSPGAEDPAAGILFPNAKETEVLTREGPSFYEMPGYSIAYMNFRMRGVFYIPMNFESFPNDQQTLDIQMTSLAKSNQVIYSNISQNINASGYYVAGGTFMPPEMKKDLGLLDETGCPLGPNGEVNISGNSNFEDLSGWAISKKVQVLEYNADLQDCMWYSPCDALLPLKFSYMYRWMELSFQAMGIPWAPYEPMSEEAQAGMAMNVNQTFIVFRLTVCRRAGYFMENVVIVIMLLNVINILSLLSSPKNVEHRLATTGTMVLALAALQAFVAEDLPRAGYQTNGQWFVKISNIMMILAAMESVVVYIACEKSWSVIRLFNRGWDREGALTEHEMQMWDHVFIVFYLVLYMSLTDMLFTSVQNVWEPSLIVGLATIVCLFIFHRMRLTAFAKAKVVDEGCGGDSKVHAFQEDAGDSNDVSQGGKR